MAAPAWPSVAQAEVTRAGERALQIRTDRQSDGRGVEVNFVAVVNAPVGAVERVLSDPRGFAEWLPRFKELHSIEVDAGSEAGPRFDSTMALPWPVGDVREQAVLQRRELAGGVELTWEHVSGDMQDNDWRFSLRAVGPDATEVRFNGDMEFTQWLPNFAVDMGQRLYAPWFLDSLERRAVAVATLPTAQATAPSRSPPPPASPPSPSPPPASPPPATR